MSQPPSRRPRKVLILCTGNSARSILAEYLLRAKGGGRFETYSAGAKPTGRVNPLALRVLKERYGIDASGARSKSWDEFRTNASALDLVITVCGNADQACPIFPGGPIKAHFPSPDPDTERLFLAVADQISRRMDALCALTDEAFTPERIQAIGEQFPLADDVPLPRGS